MLLGRYYTHISVKGRVALPTRFKKIIGNKLLIARWYENCLVIVSESAWQGFIERITLPDEILVESIRGIDRFVLGSTYELEIDDQGRFVIPKYLRDYAQLADDVIFVGLGDRIELWAKNKWDDYERSISKKAFEALEKLTQKK
jgi:MraZ protein